MYKIPHLNNIEKKNNNKDNYTYCERVYQTCPQTLRKAGRYRGYICSVVALRKVRSGESRETTLQSALTESTRAKKSKRSERQNNNNSRNDPFFYRRKAEMFGRCCLLIASVNGLFYRCEEKKR